jgi:uncharacterized protein YjbJ (UPF0337 family)
MNKDTLKGDWNLIKGKIKEKWGKLTEDDLTEINGKREQLLGKIQKKYGFAKERAEEELTEWEKSSRDKSEYEREHTRKY